MHNGVAGIAFPHSEEGLLTKASFPKLRRTCGKRGTDSNRVGGIRAIRSVILARVFVVRLARVRLIHVELVDVRLIYVRLAHPAQNWTIYPGTQRPLPIIRRLIRTAWNGRKPLRHIGKRYQSSGLRWHGVVRSTRMFLRRAGMEYAWQHANAVPPRSQIGKFIVPTDIGKLGQQRKSVDGAKQLYHDPHQGGMVAILHNTANASRPRGERGNC